jgi:DNA gyrase subunit B
VDAGRIFIAQPPLYKIKRGKDNIYAYSDEEKDSILRQIGDFEIGETNEVEDLSDRSRQDVLAPSESNQKIEKKSDKKLKVSISRYKGLGEMNPEELWETTMNPEKRILKKVTIEDAQEADKVFDILMGTDVVARKAFIQTNAQSANLDI